MINRKEHRNTIVLLAACCTLALTAALALGQQPPRYLVDVLDSFDGGHTKAYALNDLGQVTGESGGHPNTFHAFVWERGGTLLNIESPDCTSSEGLEINNSGQVGGHAQCAAFGGAMGPVLYSPGTGMVPLDLIDGRTYRVIDMNEAGDVLGSYSAASHQSRVCLYTDEDGVFDLGSFGIGSIYGRDINESGQVAGYGYMGDGTGSRPFLWEDGQLHNLGSFGGMWNEAYYINSAGATVGEATYADGTQVAFVHTTDTGMQPLPLPEGATSCAATWITDDGLIFGEWAGEWPSHRAFYYTESEGLVDIDLELGSVWWTGTMAANNAGEIVILTHDEETYELAPYYFSRTGGVHHLHDLLTIEIEWMMEEPTDINEVGQITVIGRGQNQQGQWRTMSAMLTPVRSGDLNCDGVVDFDDIDPFVLALGSPAAYAEAYPLCASYFADINGDGAVNFDDIDPFVAILSGG